MGPLPAVQGAGGDAAGKVLLECLGHCRNVRAASAASKRTPSLAYAVSRRGRRAAPAAGAGAGPLQRRVLLRVRGGRGPGASRPFSAAPPPPPARHLACPEGRRRTA